MENLQNQKDLPVELVVIVVPFPAQGHLNQLIQLSCLITERNIPLYFIGSAVHNRQTRIRVNGLNPLDVTKIRFFDVPTRPFESPAPVSGPACRFPSQLSHSWTATLSQREPVASFLQQMASKSKRVVVIHDPLMSFVVQDVASIPNAESYVFNCISAFYQAAANCKRRGKPFPMEMPELLLSIEANLPDEVASFVSLQAQLPKFCAGDLRNTCRLLERPYLEMIESQAIVEDRKSWVIGPILPVKLPSIDGRNKWLQWLDVQKTGSVLFVNFGTTVSLLDEEIKELAIGLEKSRQKFIWVLRDADKGNIFDGEVRQAQLPEGWEKRVEGLGIVVRDWAPQPEILAHPATGGFLSHCGWNSCIESLTMGVPILAWPMHSDQPRNAYFVTEILKVGLLAVDWDQIGEIVTASRIENAVKRLMRSDDGPEIRKRAEELGRSLRQATEEGGLSRQELNSFLDHISRS